MSSRPIVRDPDELYGRWRFDGTRIPVADVRLAVTADPTAAMETLQLASLSPDDIEAAMAFEFPVLHGPEVHLAFGVVNWTCVCGEEESISHEQVGSTIVRECPCGRRWSVQLTLAQV